MLIAVSKNVVNASGKIWAYTMSLQTTFPSTHWPNATNIILVVIVMKQTIRSPTARLSKNIFTRLWRSPAWVEIIIISAMLPSNVSSISIQYRERWYVEDAGLRPNRLQSVYQWDGRSHRQIVFDVDICGLQIQRRVGVTELSIHGARMRCHDKCL